MKKPKLALGLSLAALVLGACAPSTTAGGPQAPAEPPAFVKEFQAYMEGPKRSLREDVELLLKPIQEADLEALWNLRQVPTIWDRVLERPRLRGLYACLYAEKSDLLVGVTATPLARQNDPLTAETWLKDPQAREKLKKQYGGYRLGERVLVRSETIYADLVKDGKPLTLVVRLGLNPNWEAVSRTALWAARQRAEPEGWRKVPEGRTLYSFLGDRLFQYLNNPPSLWDQYCPSLRVSAVDPSSTLYGATLNLDTLLFSIGVDTKSRP